jgi:CubicO group peptidase (beta-lactamase class C family)
MMFVLSGLVAVCPAAARPESEDNHARVAAPRSLDELKARVAAILAEEHIPGAGVALVTRDDGVVWAGGIGKADIERGIDVTAETAFRVGSISKCFVALAVMRLAQEGKLSLDAKLKDLAPELAFENRWESSHPVTVAHLLEHTAGFDDTRPMAIFATRDDLPLRDVLAIDPRGRVSRWPPGSRYSYSNPGYTILGYLVEKTTGRTFEDYIRDTLFLPLGMVHADFRRTRTIAARLARGYVDSVPTPVEYLTELQRPAAQLHASPAEIAHLVELWLGRGIVDGKPLFSEKTLASMRRPHTLPPTPLGWAYGAANEPEFVNGWVAPGHSGSLVGFSSEARYIPELGVGWVLLLNTSVTGNGMTRLNELLARYLTHDAAPPPAPTGTAPSPEELAGYAGYYEYQDSMQEALHGVDYLLYGRTVFVKDGQLWAQDFLESPVRLIPTGAPAAFRGETDRVTTIVFAHREDGDVMLTAAYRVKRSPWRIRSLRTVVFGSLALMMSSLLFALAWAPLWLFNQRYRARAGRLRTRTVPLLASILGLISIALLYGCNSQRVFAPIKNALTISLFVVPILFAVASAAALVIVVGSLSRRGEMNRVLKAHCLSVALASSAIAVWMACCGWIGLAVWAY